jgi:CheY-like chemotaxis protein
MLGRPAFHSPYSCAPLLSFRYVARLVLFQVLQMRILSISTDLELLQLRQFILEGAGHEVVNLDSEKSALKAAESSDHFDVVLLCHRLPSAAGRQATRLFRHHHPDTRVVYIAHVYGEWPDVEADRYIVGTDGPEALVRVLQEVHA